jgi:putative multiple sugar transport system permease protein
LFLQKSAMVLKFGANRLKYGLLASLIVIMVFFQVATGGALMQPLNLTNLLLQKSYIVVMALEC